MVTRETGLLSHPRVGPWGSMEPLCARVGDCDAGGRKGVPSYDNGTCRTTDLSYPRVHTAAGRLCTPRKKVFRTGMTRVPALQCGRPAQLIT